ncbi:hypothetical protein PF011_g32643 [Phytophthora fragariae]|uniref:Uncharacterized protein n=1 Tax=Phytophthora fragariae TaxID=53985 RepID=A0A6A3GFL4_9STRA|nr:hypothetical protein PF011_g32643 [Phytophthora fragariae]
MIRPKMFSTRCQMQSTTAKCADFEDSDMKKAQVTFAVLQDKLRTYRKRAEKHLVSVALGAANFQARQEKAQQERNGEIAKLEKRIADFECKGPCTTFEEFTESEKKRRNCTSSSAE